MISSSPLGDVLRDDNLVALKRISDESVDLVYLDPPFNSGSKRVAANGSFNDAWGRASLRDDDVPPSLLPLIAALGDVGASGARAYLLALSPRLVELRRVLRPSGSLMLHVDPAMSHSLKILLDALFGTSCFINELIWRYRNASRGRKRFAAAHDVILWYAKTKGRHVFNRDAVLAPYESGMTAWRYAKAGRPPPQGKTPDDVIDLPALNAMDNERVGYPTQKPSALLRLLISAATRRGDLVLDPFCGSGTTCVAAESLGRRWIGIDRSADAIRVTRRRVGEARGV